MANDTPRIDNIEQSAVMKYQRKVMTTNNTPSQMNFNNLTIGKTYRLVVDWEAHNVGSSAYRTTAQNNGNVLVFFGVGAVGATATTVVNASSERIFVATGLDVTFEDVISGGNLVASATSATLEELPNHIETTDWA